MNISADEISQDDTIRLVRVATKCADLLIDFDVINDLYLEKKSKYIKHNLKKPFELIGFELDKFSSAFLKPFVKADQLSQMELQKMFRELTLNIYFINDEFTALTTMYSKVVSISNDIAEMEFNDHVISYIKETCDTFSKAVEIKYKGLFAKKDKHGKGVSDIIKAYDKLGKTIMHS